jgi:cyclomaltodextrinase
MVLLLLVLLLISCGSSEKPKQSTYPAWVKDAVFYQIFPERFRNGDPGNDPQAADLEGSWPHDPVAEWQVSPWTSDWYQLQPWEKANGRGFNYNTQLRRYGGDLQGVLDKLDYLQELGITAIYFNPLFESPSLHKYDATSYHHIDDNFGPNPAADRKIVAGENPADPSTWQWTTADTLFLHLIKEMHRRNMKVIIDGVFNHTGMTFWAFLDVKKNGKNSPYYNWYTIKQVDDPATPENEFDYEGWFGVRELPEIREDDNGLVAGPRQHVFDVVKRWMDPNGDGDPSDGIDGWRLDVAEKVRPEFWREFRTVVKSVNPQAYITAELFWENWEENKLMDPTPWMTGDQFDGVMNYRWSLAVTNFAIDHQKKITASEFLQRLQTLWDDVSDSTNYMLQNLTNSHDTDRLASNIVNPDLMYDKYISVNDNPDYDVRKPDAEEFQRMKLIIFLQMMYPGAPMIYYGDEAGMWGADDPDDRKPMVWPEFTYDDEVSHPLGKKRPRDTVEFNKEIFEQYRVFISVRKQTPAIRNGKWQPLVIDDAKDSFVVMVGEGGDHALIAVNNSDQPQILPVNNAPGRIPGSYMEMVTNRNVVIPKDPRIVLTVPARSGAIYRYIEPVEKKP